MGDHYGATAGDAATNTRTGTGLLSCRARDRTNSPLSRSVSSSYPVRSIIGWFLSSLPAHKRMVLLLQGAGRRYCMALALGSVLHSPASRRRSPARCDDEHGRRQAVARGEPALRKRGTVDHFGLHGEDDIIQVGTLSKAWGVVGGYAAGPRGLDKLLRNTARPLVFSTSLPPAVIGAAIAALELVDRSPETIARLWDNTKRFRHQLQVLTISRTLSSSLSRARAALSRPAS